MSARLWTMCVAVAALLSSGSLADAAGKRYALLVGVKEYDHADFTKLDFTENDVEELAKVLKEAGYHEVVILTSTRGKEDAGLKPTAKNIRERLSKLSDKVKKEDLLLVGLAGHGVRWPVVDPETKKERDESFFCPADARLRSEQTLEQLKKTMIPLGELFRSLDESGAGVRLMLVDACREDAKNSRNIGFDDLPRTKRGTAVLFSCKGGERAFETKKRGKGHGVFFYHVIQALKGEVKGKKGEVTWNALAEHVIDKVTEDVPEVIGGGAKQTPHEIRNIEGRSPLVLGQRAAREDAEQLYQRGVDAVSGRKGEWDGRKALKLFNQAAERGHEVANGNAGRMIWWGSGADRNQQEGLRRIKDSLPAVRRLAEAGDADAQCLLGGLYADGLCLEKNASQAVAWFRKAADKGHLAAMSWLGWMCENGLGVSKNEKEAMAWYRKAADEGEVGAMINLGGMHLHGRGVKKDQKGAAAWFRNAADRGHPRAMFVLGGLYENGTGVAKDRAEALRWYKKAADLGEENAMKKVKELEPGN